MSDQKEVVDAIYEISKAMGLNLHISNKDTILNNLASILKRGQITQDPNEPGIDIETMPDGRKFYLMAGTDKLHRLVGPAIETPSMTMWCREGNLHREDGPALILTEDALSYWKNGSLHRDDGPAIVDEKNKIKEYYLHGYKFTAEELEETKNQGLTFEQYPPYGYAWKNEEGLISRDDGPAVYNGSHRYWMKDDFPHRIDGPAIEGDLKDISFMLFDTHYYIHGFPFTKEEYLEIVANKLDVGLVDARLSFHENVSGYFHRLGGPAIYYDTGKVEYWIAGAYLEKDEYDEIMRLKEEGLPIILNHRELIAADAGTPCHWRDFKNSEKKLEAVFNHLGRLSPEDKQIFEIAYNAKSLNITDNSTNYFKEIIGWPEDKRKELIDIINRRLKEAYLDNEAGLETESVWTPDDTDPFAKRPAEAPQEPQDESLSVWGTVAASMALALGAAAIGANNKKKADKIEIEKKTKEQEQRLYK